jgi:hypothetical protein
MRLLVRALTLAAIGFAVSPVHATGADPAAAETLFNSGRQAFAAGDYRVACENFAESHRLDPAAGTLINLAACYERMNKLATAWEVWRQALVMLPPADERRPEVQRRAASLQARLPHLEVRLPPDAPAGIRVMRDDVELGAASLGISLPVDPGPHTIRVLAPGRLERKLDLEITEGQKLIVSADSGAPLPAREKPESKAVPAAPAAVDTRRAQDPEAPSHSSRRVLGVIVSGFGAAALVTGTATGILAIQQKHAMDRECTAYSGTPECSPEGMDAARRGERFATVSTISFVTFAVASGVGAYLILSSRDERVTKLGTHFRSGGASVSLSRSF